MPLSCPTPVRWRRLSAKRALNSLQATQARSRRAWSGSCARPTPRLNWEPAPGVAASNIMEWAECWMPTVPYMERSSPLRKSFRLKQKPLPARVRKNLDSPRGLPRLRPEPLLQFRPGIVDQSFGALQRASLVQFQLGLIHGSTGDLEVRPFHQNGLRTERPVAADPLRCVVHVGAARRIR